MTDDESSLIFLLEIVDFLVVASLETAEERDGVIESSFSPCLSVIFKLETRTNSKVK